MLVKLTYFDFKGKYRTEGSYRTKFEHLYEIFNEVKMMLDIGNLPGMISGRQKVLVHVNVPDHPLNHPVLILPRGVLIHD